ncbi:MAG: hypothetical protein SGJ18_00815 [Pseudomonadota bacterium]|nr:hypothetical protein [Pseudomonadota bacterium]
MSNLKLLVTGLLFLNIVSCKSIEDIKGRYHGILKIDSKVQQVVTEIPDLKDSGEYETLEFTLYETIASAKPQRIIVQLNDDILVLKSTFLGSEDYRLKVESGRCGTGENSQTTATLCIEPGLIDFRLKDKSSGALLINLNLVRNNDLPIPPTANASSGLYTLDELVGRAKFSSYPVAQEAEKVFQSRQRVKVALGNLLPHFNMRDLLSFAGGPLGGIEAIGNLIPFIFPSNWYKWDEAEELEQAQRKSFASLRGNEMQFVENFFYLVGRDIGIFDLMEKELTKQREIHRIIVQKERHGLLPPKSADKYYTNILLVEQDLTQLRSLINFELGSLAHAVAVPPASGISKLETVVYPDLSKISPIDHKKLIETAQKKSYEVATLNYLIEASRLNKKTHAWGFLDPNSDDSIGFGYASTLRIGDSNTRELSSKRDETLSMIEQRVFVSASEYNASLASFGLSESGIKTAQARLERLARRLHSGDEKVDDDYFVQEMVEASQSLLKFSANRVTAIHTYLISLSKINRLIQEGYYNDLELFNEEGK